MSTSLDRRAFVGYFSALGLGGTLFPGVLWARAQEAGKVTREMVTDAEAVAGIEFTDAERDQMLDDLNDNLAAYAKIHAVPVPNAVPPAVRFDAVLPGRTVPARRLAYAAEGARAGAVRRPARLEDVAFWPVAELAELVRTRQVSATELTRMYLERLKRHGPALECVITLTEERALAQAARADAEIAAGRWRGPLHGIPWGAKDLLAVKGYRTTWGARPYEEQVIEEDAEVVRRLDEAGAILVAKLTLGALAMGDYWYGGRTRNPWNPEQGSSGSSAGSASAAVAGLVGFAIGSETLGSIVSPSTRCGASGLRPTFGRVSRAGAMALSWSMDKLGPICRSAEDCALVLQAVHGADGRDPTARDADFHWDPAADVRGLRVGYHVKAFESERATAFDSAALEAVRALGVEPVPVEFDDGYPVGELVVILAAEAAAAFNDLTRSGRDELLVRQGPGAWPNTFRSSQLIPAVAYIQANRVRTLLMESTERALADVDVLVTPSYGGDILTRTNLTGHPQVVVPSGFTEKGTPTSISFVGRLWGEAPALALAHAYQGATGWHRRVPPLFE